MRKKLLSLLLVFALVLSLCPAALAAEDDIRETNFFTDQPRADVDYADMEYEHMEREPFDEALDAVYDLLDDEDSAKEVKEHFEIYLNEYMQLAAMYQLANIRTYQDVTNEEYDKEYQYTRALLVDVEDTFFTLVRDILKSPCAAFLEEQLSEEEIMEYLAYEEMTEQEKALDAEETALVAEYQTTAASITVEYNGEDWTGNDAYYAYMDNEISIEDYRAIYSAYIMKQNEVLGEIYLRMVDVRKEIAGAAGYDTYTDYAYSERYGRDYTKEDIRAFHQAVKDIGFCALEEDIYDLSVRGMDSDVYYGDYTGDTALDMIEPYLRRMSGELVEAFSYMREHGLYDTGYGENKGSMNFTTLIYGYNAPFFFASPSGYIGDFTTAVHEFGHYNNFYWEPSGWNDAGKSYDAYEVHSQGMEMLFSHWYGEIFGDSAQALLDSQVSNLLYAIYTGAIYDELQQFVYETEDVTLEQINEKYGELQQEYGMVNQLAGMYNWVTIPHTFESPLYYISYAVSASGALAFWLEAQENDYFDVLDEYLKFAALPAEMGFQESFTALGMDNPLSSAYLEHLAETLRTVMDVDARLNALEEEGKISFSDVTENDWFYEYVMFMASYGSRSGMGISGYEDGTFRPYENAVVGLLDDAVENPEEPLLREEFCQILAASIPGMTSGSGVSPFSDTDDLAVAAVAELGIVNGYGDGTFRPDQPMTRAEYCTALYRMLRLILTGSSYAD